MVLGDWLKRREQLTPEQVALWEHREGGGPGRPISYRQWNRSANRTAALLAGRLGVGRGDRVAVLAGNCVEYLDLWFALGKLGAVLQCLNWRLLPEELCGLLRAAPPVALVYGEEQVDKVRELRARLGPAQPRWVALGAPAQEGDLPLRAREDLPDLPPPAVALGWDDPWVICYTGGSTGLPKGAVLTHRSITANAVNTVISWGLRQDDVAILDAPLFHTGGLNVLTAPLVYVGGASVVCRRFQPEQTFDLWRDAGVTLYFGVPTMFLMLQEHPRWAGADLRRLRVVISGGAPCPQPVFERFFSRGVDFRTGYGLTEAGPNNFWLPVADVRRKAGAVGVPLFHVDAQVVAQDGRPCAPGEVGELVLRGPHLCAGYLNDPAASAAAIHPLAAQGNWTGTPGERADGAWLHTGDLAQVNAEGCYTIAGRVKDLIISGGENIYPAEIESVLHGHPGVLEAAVIGVADPRWGEVPCALVVPRPTAASAVPLDEAAVLLYLRGRLAGYKLPRSVVFVAELPRTGANKIDRRELRRRHGAPHLSG